MNSDERSDLNNSSCPTYLLDDAPSPIDELAQNNEIGPHQRISDAIAELIRPPVTDDSLKNNQADGGKMIGIEGGWGTGKTTVVELLRKQFNGDEATGVTVFDAWAHRGDPLRRTFLESLVADLRSIKWISEEMFEAENGWKATIDSIAKRRRESTTTKKSITTPLGSGYAITALFVPIGAALVGGTLSAWGTEGLGFFLKLYLSFGLLFSLSPILLTLGYTICEIYNGRTPDFALLKGGDAVKQRTYETELPDPTSLEFEQYFYKLMGEVLAPFPDRQLVLVLDNLDRVNADEALAIWSTLQTFLQFTGRQDNSKWIKRLWVIVPYDPGGLRALWEEKAQKVEEATIKDQATRQEDNEEGANSEDSENRPLPPTFQSSFVVADSFIDKSFQIRFELPPPVHSNWRGYLRKLIKEAMPQHEGQAEELCRVYSFVQPGHNPTPRDLKLFVNQMGMIHRQWRCGTFPLSHIAYYVLLKRLNYDVPKYVPNLPHPGIEKQLQNSSQFLHESLAGLSFNVEPALGMEIVLKDQISRAILNEEPNTVEKLATNYSPGFWLFINDIIRDDIAQADYENFEKALRCCMKSAAFFKEYRKACDTGLFSVLGDRVAEQNFFWPAFNTATGKALGVLAECLNEESRTISIADSIRRTGKPKENEKEPTLDAEFLKGISAFISEALRIGHEKAINKPFPIACTVQQWIELAPKLKDEREDFSKPALWSYLEPSVGPVEIVKEIVSIASSSERIQELISNKTPLAEIVEVTDESNMNLDWTPLMKACEKRLNHGQNVNGKEANELLRTLLYFYKTDKETPISKLVNQGHIYHCLSHAESQKHRGCKVRCLVAIMIIRPDLSEANKMPGSAKDGFNYMIEKLLKSNDNQDAKALLSVTFDEIKSSVLFESIGARPQWDPLFIKAFQILADDSSRRLELPTDLIINKWPSIAQQINEDDPQRFSRLIEALAKEGVLTEELYSKGFEVEYIGLYIEIINTTKSKSFIEWCVEGLKSAVKNDWIKAFRDENKLFDLIISLKEAGASFRMPHYYRDALIDFAEEVMKNGNVKIPSLLQSGKIDAFELLKEDSQKADFQTRCASKLINQGGQISPVFFEGHPVDAGIA